MSITYIPYTNTDNMTLNPYQITIYHTPVGMCLSGYCLYVNHCLCLFLH